MLAYFDCSSGISGDMTLGALIDLGIPLKHLENRLKSIPLKNFRVTVTSVHRNGIKAMSVFVGMYDDRTARSFADIRSLVENSPLSEKIKSTSLQIFRRLATSEAHIHSCAYESGTIWLSDGLAFRRRGAGCLLNTCFYEEEQARDHAPGAMQSRRQRKSDPSVFI